MRQNIAIMMFQILMLFFILLINHADYTRPVAIFAITICTLAPILTGYITYLTYRR